MLAMGIVRDCLDATILLTICQHCMAEVSPVSRYGAMKLERRRCRCDDTFNELFLPLAPRRRHAFLEESHLSSPLLSHSLSKQLPTFQLLLAISPQERSIKSRINRGRLQAGEFDPQKPEEEQRNPNHDVRRAPSAFHYKIGVYAPSIWEHFLAAPRPWHIFGDRHSSIHHVDRRSHGVADLPHQYHIW
ncbi:hypothetical protein BT69DRAFT_202301 [Atractiella rhizophila]|nr:hypothetical protein BT69DRAFT_202301 [Atractiella rhizophila]